MNLKDKFMNCFTNDINMEASVFSASIKYDQQKLLSWVNQGKKIENRKSKVNFGA